MDERRIKETDDCHMTTQGELVHMPRVPGRFWPEVCRACTHVWAHQGMNETEELLGDPDGGLLYALFTQNIF